MLYSCIRIHFQTKDASDISTEVIFINLPTNCNIALLFRLARSTRISSGHGLVHLRRSYWAIGLSARQFSLYCILVSKFTGLRTGHPSASKEVLQSACLKSEVHLFNFVSACLCVCSSFTAVPTPRFQSRTSSLPSRVLAFRSSQHLRVSLYIEEKHLQSFVSNTRIASIKKGRTSDP